MPKYISTNVFGGWFVQQLPLTQAFEFCGLSYLFGEPHLPQILNREFKR